MNFGKLICLPSPVAQLPPSKQSRDYHVKYVHQKRCVTYAGLNASALLLVTFRIQTCRHQRLLLCLEQRQFITGDHHHHSKTTFRHDRKWLFSASTRANATRFTLSVKSTVLFLWIQIFFYVIILPAIIGSCTLW